MKKQAFIFYTFCQPEKKDIGEIMGELERVYQQCLTAGFSPLGQAEPASGTAAFTLAKEENTSLCLLQVADLSRMDEGLCRFLHNQELDRAAALNPMYSSIWVVFLWIGGHPSFETAEAFYGQSPYAIYWHLNPATQQITVSPDQPDDVMGLRTAIKLKTVGALPPLPPAGALPPHPRQGTSPLDPVIGGDSGEGGYGKGGAQGRIVRAPSAPVVTIMLASANVVVMLLMYLQGYAAMPIVVAARFGAIVPSLIWGAGEYYRLFTAMFVHFGWTHLFFNVAGIFIFGTRIERYYGRAAYLAIYFIAGLAASVASLLLTRGISAGASGAVYGLLGAAFVYTRYTRRPMDMINNHIIMVYIIMGVAMGFIMPNIDYFGHIGGLISGMIIGRIAVGLIDNDK